MKALEFYLSVAHFCYYNADVKLHLLANRVNPFYFIHRLHFQKRRHENLGVDIRKEIDKAFSDKNFELSTSVAGAVLLVM